MRVARALHLRAALGVNLPLTARRYLLFAARSDEEIFHSWPVTLRLELGGGWMF